MGKVLIIKDVDFSENAIDRITITDYVPTKLSGNYVFYMDYTNTSAIRQLRTESAAGASIKLFVADVSDYVGRSIDITAATNVIEGAKYACFSSDLGGFTFNQISELGPIPSSSSEQMIITTITTISSFNISAVGGVKTTIRKEVPTGAKYLVVGVYYGEGFTDAELDVTVV